MKNKSLVLLLSFLFSFALNSIQAATLHAFIVADTHAENIENSVEMDLIKMESFIAKAARFSEMDLNKFVFQSYEATSRFADSFDQIDVQDDDVIIFYWSGHGFRTKDKDLDDNPWPSFSFANDHASMDQLDITEYLMAKGPRLLITFTDTCNEYMPDSWAAPIVTLTHKGKWAQSKIEFDQMKRNYKRLFRETSGVIMAAGSMPGEYSWCFWSGAVFTSSFLQAFDAEVMKPEADWNQIFIHSKEALDRLLWNVEQTPLVQLDIDQLSNIP